MSNRHRKDLLLTSGFGSVSKSALGFGPTKYDISFSESRIIDICMFYGL
jgi:hypothetical protein